MESTRENLSVGLVVIVLIAAISIIGVKSNDLFKKAQSAFSNSLSAPDQPLPPASADSLAAPDDDSKLHPVAHLSVAPRNLQDTLESSLITNRSSSNGPLPASYVAKRIHARIRLRTILIKNGSRPTLSLIACNGSKEPPTLIPSPNRLFDYMRTHGIEFEWHQGDGFVDGSELYSKCKQLAKPIQPSELL